MPPAPFHTPQSSARLSCPSLPRRSGRSYWGCTCLPSVYVSLDAHPLIIPFPEGLHLLFQLINVPASIIPLSRNFDFFIRRDVRHEDKEAIAQDFEQDNWKSLIARTILFSENHDTRVAFCNWSLSWSLCAYGGLIKLDKIYPLKVRII